MATKHKEGQCPVCGGQDLDYGETEMDDHAEYQQWWCRVCGAEGYEQMNKTFAGMVNIDMYPVPNMITPDC